MSDVVNKRTFDEIIYELKLWIESGVSTFVAMACTLEEEDWNTLVDRIEELQKFWNEHHPPTH